jgi:hypothetical protein
VSPCVPKSGRPRVRPFPPVGSGSAPVPHLPRYYGLLRLLRARPGGLWSPSTARYRPLAETWRSPTFVGNPSESVPRARDSGGSRAPRIAVLGMQPSVVRTTSASATRVISELNPRGPLPCCLRFTSPVARRRCKTRYRPARYGVDRAGFSPAGLHSGVSRAHVRSSPATLFVARPNRRRSVSPAPEGVFCHAAKGSAERKGRPPPPLTDTRRRADRESSNGVLSRPLLVRRFSVAVVPERSRRTPGPRLRTTAQAFGPSALFYEDFSKTGRISVHFGTERPYGT